MLKQLNLTSNQSVPAPRPSSRVRVIGRCALVIGHWTLVITLTAFLALAPCPALASSRVKDIAMVAGARDNQLVGYGLITGIAGDGDKNPVYTLQTVANFLQRFGMNVPPATLSSKNVAAVIVTADISAFKKNGSRLDVTISSIGDAKTLQGGILLQTPLLGADGKVYAVDAVDGPAAASASCGRKLNSSGHDSFTRGSALTQSTWSRPSSFIVVESRTGRRFTSPPVSQS